MCVFIISLDSAIVSESVGLDSKSALDSVSLRFCLCAFFKISVLDFVIVLESVCGGRFYKARF
ncbi:hypothetical protein [uncultured Helicobacter sp.]|uniref:hypothetical protein n=1 Tax=uncultured Helicobacter sp. TaxID=175537 RepID=UPI00375360F3